MTLTSRLIKIFLFSSTLLGSSLSVVKSYETLKNRSEPTHATPHINNLIRNGLGQLNKDERDKLDAIGLRIIGNRITTMDPVLDQIYDTEHFRFYYTLQDNDAVENIDYILRMGAIFEEVRSFYMDSIGFEFPPVNSDGLYEVRIENLPSFYFGYAVAL